MTNSIVNFFKKIWHSIKESSQSTTHTYRLITVDKDKNDNYIATVQLTNKNQIFKMRPEEILADDKITSLFSQCDIRTLTYLGYLELNSPKYKILAKRLSEQDNRLIFAIQERGNDELITKTAEELSRDKDILSSLNQEDAHMVGYISASEQSAQEKSKIQKLLDSEKRS